MTDLKIKSALEGVGRDPDAATMSNGEIKESVRKRLEIDSADSFDLEDSFSVEPRGNMKIVRITYETTVPMAFNISALIHFDHRVEVRGGQ